jgi:Secretion system C-terminal sorting domain
MSSNHTTFSHKAIGAKMLVAAFFLLVNSPLVFSQITATISGGACASASLALAVGPVVNGRNSYTGAIGTMSWNSVTSRWEVIAPVLGLVFYNEANTTPNPPCHNNGTWVAWGTCINGTFTASSGTCTVPLPIELLFFSVKNLTATNSLTWQTASEKQNKGFEIERSNDGQMWQTLSFVAAKGNNSTYSFTDKEPLSTSYYRLRQIDVDGQSDYSKVVVAKSTSGKSSVSVFPNPNTEGVIHVQGLAGDKTDISITNIYGQIVFQQTLFTESAALNLRNTLPKGVYFVNLKANNTVLTHKISFQ